MSKVPDSKLTQSIQPLKKRHPLWGKILTWPLEKILQECHQNQKTPCFLVTCKNDKEQEAPEKWLGMDSKAVQIHWSLATTTSSDSDHHIKTIRVPLSVPEFKIENLSSEWVLYSNKLWLPVLDQFSKSPILFSADRWLSLTLSQDHQQFLYQTQHLPLVFCLSPDPIFFTQLAKLIFL